MADLNNLLDEMEVNDDDGVGDNLSNNNHSGDVIQNDDGDGDVQGQIRDNDDANRDHGEADDPLPSRRPVIPSALAMAAQQQQQKQKRRFQEDGLRIPRSGPYNQDDDDDDDEFPSNEGFDDDDNQNQQEGERIPDQDYEQLKHLWISELTSPELMPHDSETVALHVEVLAGQEESVDDLWGMSRVHHGDGGRGNGRTGDGPTGEMASLMAQILKMDLDRTRFMLVDLARSRMAKIENHALFNRELVDRMTDEEVNYLKQYGELLERHHRRTVLNHLPKEAYRKLDEPEMIDSPDLEQFVFCRVLETVQIDVRRQTNGNEKLGLLGDEEEGEEDQYGDEDLDGVQEHEPGSCLIVMYKVVRNLVLEGKIELML